MFVLALPILAGVFVGALLCGHLRRWNGVHFRYCAPAAAALALQLAIFNPPLDHLDALIRFGPALYIGSMLGIAFVLIQNARANGVPRRSVALLIASLGVLLNCLVVTANGGYMPRAATDGWPAVSEPSASERLVNVAPIGRETRLVFLADILPEPRWIPLPNILSIGDVLLAGGLGSWA